MKVHVHTLFALVLGVALVLPVTASALTTNLISVADTTLFEHDPDNNLGGQGTMVAGVIRTGPKSRALFRFDVAGALPAGATVTSATLLLTVIVPRADGLDFNLHRMLKSWGEGASSGQGGGLGGAAASGEATWNARFHPGTLWDSPGGEAGIDYETTPSAIAVMAPPSLEFSSSEMVADVQMWLNSPSTNFGWMVAIADEDTTQTASHLGTRADPDTAPKLSITYTVPSPPASATPPTMFNVALAGNNFRFTFNAQSNRTYAVEFRDSLTTTNWSVLANLPAQPTDTTLHFTNAVSVAERYFRVRTP